MSTSYATTCPKCGQQLTPVALSPDTAPWLCAHCARGWWQAELSAAARAVYRPAFGDHGFGAGRLTLVALRDSEHAAAHTRGTSALPEQLPVLPGGVLAELASRRGLDPGFAGLVAAEVTRRGAS